MYYAWIRKRSLRNECPTVFVYAGGTHVAEKTENFDAVIEAVEAMTENLR